MIFVDILFLAAIFGWSFLLGENLSANDIKKHGEANTFFLSVMVVFGVSLMVLAILADYMNTPNARFSFVLVAFGTHFSASGAGGLFAAMRRKNQLKNSLE